MLLALLACATPDYSLDSDTESDGPRDLRLDPSQADGADFVIQTPDYIIPSQTDRMYCLWGTWQGPTAGVNVYEFNQSPGFGHHGMLNQVDDRAEDIPDGTYVDCTTPEDQPMISNSKPLLAGTEVVGPGHGRMVLPEGKAVKIREGQRWMFQSHYINSSDHPILVRDLAWGWTLPQEEVQAWVGSYTFNNSDISLPPQQDSHRVFDCAWGADLHLLSIAGHMHHAGTSMFGAIVGPEQAVEEGERIYDVAVWNGEWRDAPQILTFPGDGLPVQADERLYGSCTWYNTTDETLGFPHEMCVLMGLAWPLEEAIGCDAAHPDPQ